MDKVEKYRQMIKDYTNWHDKIVNEQSHTGAESVAVLDDAGGHYQWVCVGWEGRKRVFDLMLYVRLRGGKVYVEEDFTEQGIGNYLVKQGVPKADIVLAFQEPAMRLYTDFAAA